MEGLKIEQNELNFPPIIFFILVDMPFSVGEYTEKRDKDFRIICLTVDKYQPTTRISFPLLYIWKRTNQSIICISIVVSGTKNHNRSNKLFIF